MTPEAKAAPTSNHDLAPCGGPPTVSPDSPAGARNSTDKVVVSVGTGALVREFIVQLCFSCRARGMYLRYMPVVFDVVAAARIRKVLNREQAAKAPLENLTRYCSSTSVVLDAKRVTTNSIFGFYYCETFRAMLLRVLSVPVAG